MAEIEASRKSEQRESITWTYFIGTGCCHKTKQDPKISAGISFERDKARKLSTPLLRTIHLVQMPQNETLHAAFVQIQCRTTTVIGNRKAGPRCSSYSKTSEFHFYADFSIYVSAISYYPSSIRLGILSGCPALYIFQRLRTSVSRPLELDCQRWRARTAPPRNTQCLLPASGR